MSDNTSANKTIAKNTIYLYLRMLFTMTVSLYTSRVVLEVLGVSDYGLYNVIGGIVALISMLNTSMSAATQRFITFELAKQDMKTVSNTFSMSMTAHFVICAIVLILGETIGLYYVDNYLNIPEGRHDAAIWVYQITLATILVNILRIPYSASVIAYEKMGFYAWVNVIETVLRLVIVFLLLFAGTHDRLVFYAFLVFSTSVISTLIYKWYCQKKFETCNYYWVMDKSYFKKLLGFFGWNFVGGIATTGTHQVGNIILNAFCGTVANAAYGVATQINAAINGFTNNFQIAYTPQIVKLYSTGNKEEMFRLMNRTALLSFYLLFVIAIPIFLNIDLILGIWLKEVPPFAGIFCQWIILYNIIDSVQAPMWKAIAATGNIRNYEIWLNVVLIMNIPLSYFCLKSGMAPYVVVIISTVLNFVTAILRTVHVKIQIGYLIIQYLKEVISHALLFSVVYFAFWYITKQFIIIDSLLSFILFFLTSLLCSTALIYAVGLNKTDRRIIKQFIVTKLSGK